jgi:hypothetical protein
MGGLRLNSNEGGGDVFISTDIFTDLKNLLSSEADEAEEAEGHSRISSKDDDDTPKGKKPRCGDNLDEFSFDELIN